MTFLIIVLCVLLLFLFLIFPAVRKHGDRKILNGAFIAHRGLHDEKRPENSLAAFAAAIEGGYIIENDIHITADNEVVVFHDDNLKRMCGIDKKIEDMTLLEIKEARLLDTDYEIPTLTECLELVNGEVPLLIEFKCTGNKSATRLAVAANKILNEYKGKYFVQSFFPPLLWWYKRNNKAVCRGQLASGFYKDKLHMKLLGCLIFNFLARPDFVSYDHKNKGNIFRKITTLLGAMPIGWTFRSQGEIDAAKRSFKAFIFENFIPKNK